MAPLKIALVGVLGIKLLKYVRLLAVVVLAGCTQVTPSSDPQLAKPYFASGQATGQGTTRKVGELNLELSTSSFLGVERSFNRESFLGKVRGALAANNLLADNPDPSLPNINITLTRVRTPNLLGALLFSDAVSRIHGDVEVADSTGKVLQSFNVKFWCDFCFGKGFMKPIPEWLYENFAILMVDTLLGVKKDKESG
ncbi:MAG: hypothetical protein O7A62_11225 [Alphaproteobacteria bacterium]|nr:hypothetical protein [Alphaproteobacteria bacterium]